MTTKMDYGRCECECGDCAFGRHCHHGGYCQVGYEGPCTCGQCVSPFLATPKAGPHPPTRALVYAPSAQRESEAAVASRAPGRWSLNSQRKKAGTGTSRKYRVVGPWRSSLEDVERDMKLVAGGGLA